MTKRRAFVNLGVEACKAGVTGLLCVMMVTSPALASEPAVGTTTTTTPTKHKYAPLTDDEMVLHALNRLTFGPRPGDEAMVKQMGLEAWFAKQLHPETIDDSKLEARLDQYPAIKLPPPQLMAAFPTAEYVRVHADHKIGFPSDPVKFAIYSDLIAKYFDDRKAGSGVEKKPNMDGDLAPAPAAAGFATRKSTISAADLQAMWKEEEPNPHAFKTKEQMAAVADKRGVIPPMDKADVDAVFALEPQARFERLVAMNPLEMVAFRKVVKGEKAAALTAGMTPVQVEAVQAMNGPLETIHEEIAEARVVRDIDSERQLQAVMDDFWLNHFSVYARKSQPEEYQLAAYERDAILPFALGKFENMLVATAQSPAMLIYLDQWESVGPNSLKVKTHPNGNGKGDAKGINENYARELLELHTFGVRCEVTGEHPASKLDPSCAGGYTQQDVIEVAKCFTGWTLDKSVTDKEDTAVFDPTLHEPGPKHVLGKTIEENGQKEALEVLHMLAQSPATATFISMKMATRFVSDDPPPAMVARMADAYLKTGGDIKSVVSTMFHSPEFWAPVVYRAKLKTPIEFVASVVRASGVDVQDPAVLVNEVKQLGMPIYGKETPNGYSWMSDQWVSSNALVSRMNFALVFSSGKLPGAKTDWAKVLGADNAAGSPTPKTESALEGIILGQTASEHTRQTVLNNYKNPALQQTAAKNYAQDATRSDMQQGDMQQQGAMKPKANAGKRGGGNAADAPGTALDTMAGLLLGSPDFQRR